MENKNVLFQQQVSFESSIFCALKAFGKGSAAGCWEPGFHQQHPRDAMREGICRSALCRQEETPQSFRDTLGQICNSMGTN